jgi:hypothetical protein
MKDADIAAAIETLRPVSRREEFLTLMASRGPRDVG